MASLSQPLTEGRYHQVRLLVKLGVNINHRDNVTKYTPVMLCCQQPPTPVVLNLLKMLLSQGADTTVTNGDGRNMLGVAIIADNELTVRLLLSERHLDINLVLADRWGMTPLHLAVKVGSAPIVKMLTVALRRNHLHVNARDPRGMTPLMTACELGRADMALIIVRYGRPSLFMRDNVRFWSAEEWLAESELATMRPDVVEFTINILKVSQSQVGKSRTTISNSEFGTEVVSKTIQPKPVLSKQKMQEVMDINYAKLYYTKPQIGLQICRPTTGNKFDHRPIANRSTSAMARKDAKESSYPIKITKDSSKAAAQIACQSVKYSKRANVDGFLRRETPQPIPITFHKTLLDGKDQGTPALQNHLETDFINTPTSLPLLQYHSSTDSAVSTRRAGSCNYPNTSLEVLYSIYSIHHSTSYRASAVPPPDTQEPTEAEPDENGTKDEPNAKEENCEEDVGGNGKGRSLSGKRLDQGMEMMLGQKTLGLLAMTKSEGNAIVGKRWGKIKFGTLGKTKSESAVDLNKCTKKDGAAALMGKTRKRGMSVDAGSPIGVANGCSPTASLATLAQKHGVSAFVKKVRAKREVLATTSGLKDGHGAEPRSRPGSVNNGEVVRTPSRQTSSEGHEDLEGVDDSVTRCTSVEPGDNGPFEHTCTVST